MSIESFILIGGQSTRFGSPKALLRLDGRPLLEKTVETVRTAIEGKTTLVTSGPEQFLGLGLDLPFIFDIYPGRGPLGGLHAALAYARTDWILALACDYPFVTRDLLEYLGCLITGEFDAVVPLQPDGKIQPLCAFYRAKPCLRMIEEVLERNRPTPPLRSIFEHVRTRFIAFEDLARLPGSEKFFYNINTPADLDRLVE